MVQIFIVNFLCVKRESVSITDSVVDIYGLKRGRFVVPGERFPGQLLPLGQFGGRTYNHILHGHERMQDIALAGGVGSVNCQNRKQSPLVVRMNQARC